MGAVLHPVDSSKSRLPTRFMFASASPFDPFQSDPARRITLQNADAKSRMNGRPEASLLRITDGGPLTQRIQYCLQGQFELHAPIDVDVPFQAAVEQFQQALRPESIR